MGLGSVYGPRRFTSPWNLASRWVAAACFYGAQASASSTTNQKMLAVVDDLEYLAQAMASWSKEDGHVPGWLALSGGSEIPFRVARQEDASALQRVHSRCSERTIHLRFFGSMKKLSDKKARYFASTDGVDHLGLVALDPEDPNEIVAVVRYARETGDERAEYAALVEDRWQGYGVGAGLTRHLIDAAKENGVRYFYALVMGENMRMLNVFRHLGLPKRERFEEGAKRVEVVLFPE